MAEEMPEQVPAAVPDPPTAKPRARRPRWIRAIIMLALTVAAILYGVVPSLVSARNDLDLVHTASWWFLAGALVLEVTSWLCYTALTKSILPRDAPVGWPTQLSIDLTGFGLSHVLPGGGATAMGLRYQMMTSAGVAPPTVVTTTATQTLLSDVALAGCYLLGAVLSIPTVMQHRSLQLTAVIGLAVILLAVVGSIVLVRGHKHIIERLQEAESRIGAWLKPRVTRISHELVSFLRDGTRTIRACAFAMVFWLLDAACLYVCLQAYNGSHIGPTLVLTAYGFANLLGLLPLTPGGLGVVEGSLIPLLIALGTSSQVAVLGVLTWRVLQFWLPVPVAGVCYLVLKLTGRLGHRASAASPDVSTASRRP
jgi:uncharacterized protein (TIRG00374 family)